jgi:hypothetical protein
MMNFIGGFWRIFGESSVILGWIDFKLLLKILRQAYARMVYWSLFYKKLSKNGVSFTLKKPHGHEKRKFYKEPLNLNFFNFGVD